MVSHFLKQGADLDIDAAERNELQTAHMKNIQKMKHAGQLIIAVPFLGGEALRGHYIFNVSSLEEAEKLTKTDPAIQAGVLIMDLKESYGPAALMMVKDLNETLTKKSILPKD